MNHNTNGVSSAGLRKAFVKANENKEFASNPPQYAKTIQVYKHKERRGKYVDYSDCRTEYDESELKFL